MRYRYGLSLILASLGLLGCTGVLGGRHDSDGVSDDAANGAEGAQGTASNPFGAYDPELCELEPARIWKLTPDQYKLSVDAVLVSAPDASSGLSRLAASEFGFENEAGRMDMSIPDVERLFLAAGKLADHVVDEQAFSTAEPCIHADAPDAACLDTFLSGIGQLVLRGSMTDEEKKEYAEYFAERMATYDARVALHSMIRAMFMSPRFLYRPELGGEAEDGVAKMTPYEIAQSISYSLTDGPPDEELRAQAESGALAEAEVRETEVRRLLASAETAPALIDWLDQIFVPEDALTAGVVVSEFPGFSHALAADMVTETREFFEYVLWEDGGRWQSFLDASYSTVNADLATYYGADASGMGEDFVATELPNRYGILTHGSLMARLSSESEQNPIKRGRFVREALMCETVPDLPPDIDVVFPVVGDTESIRERLEEHSANGACYSCHKVMDPIGFAFGDYDASGAYAPHEPTDGYVAVDNGDDIPLEGMADLSAYLASSEQVRGCFALHAFRKTQGRLEDPRADACAVAALDSSLDTEAGSLMDLQVSLFTRQGAFLRTHQE